VDRKSNKHALASTDLGNYLLARSIQGRFRIDVGGVKVWHGKTVATAAKGNTIQFMS
jgi:hypothetical protein